MMVMFGIFQATQSLKAQEDKTEEVTELVEIIPTLDAELNDVLKDLEQFPPQVRPYLKYFTSYTLPPELNKTIGGDLSFVCNSLSSGLIIKQPEKVTDTLYRIDIRHYNWTQDAWERSTNDAEPYIRLPWIPEKVYEKIRYQSGNSLVRADWFIKYALDVQAQTDLGVKEFLYYNLLYNKKLKNLQEFRDHWAVDINKIRKFQLERGGVVDTKDSLVSRHHRLLARARTEIGYYWETWDDANVDYVEDLKATESKRSAGEVICTNFVGLQVYLLVNGKNEVVEFGDPGLVRDVEDPEDFRVRTAWSCVRCHEKGINRINDKIKSTLANNVELNLSELDKDSLYRERFYLNDINAYVEEDENSYTRVIKEVNGRTPAENLASLAKIIAFYNRNITPDQASIECGVPVAVLKEKLARAPSARLADMSNGGTIPREVWEQIKNGEYQQAQLYIHNLPSPIVGTDTQPKPEVDPEVKADQPITELVETDSNPNDQDYKPTIIDFDDIPEHIRKGGVVILEVTAQTTDLKSGNNTLARLVKGQRLQFSGEPKDSNLRNYWIEVLADGKKGYVQKNHVIAAAY
jgi:hypothetical protein